MSDLFLSMIAIAIFLASLAFPVGIIVWCFLLSNRIKRVEMALAKIQQGTKTAQTDNSIFEAVPIAERANKTCSESQPSSIPGSQPNTVSSKLASAATSELEKRPEQNVAQFNGAWPKRTIKRQANESQISGLNKEQTIGSASFVVPELGVRPEQIALQSDKLWSNVAPQGQVASSSSNAKVQLPKMEQNEEQKADSELNASSPLLVDKSDKAPVKFYKSSSSSATSSEGDMASFMLGNIFNKLGALVVIIAVGIFVKLIAPYVFFSPWIKLGVGYIAGAISIALGLVLHRNDKFRNYSEVLMGLGVAISFIITYCSCTVFELWEEKIALGISCLLLLLVYGLAAIVKRPSMLALGLVAGYFNLIISPDYSDLFITVYLLLLNLMTLIAVYRGRSWEWLSNINLFCTAIALSFELYNGPAPLITLAILGLWGMYVIYDIIRFRRDSNEHLKSLSCYFNFFILDYLTCGSLSGYSSQVNVIGLALIAISAGYGLLSFYYGKLNPHIQRSHINMSLMALLAGLCVLDLGLIRILALIAIALILAVRSSEQRSNLCHWTVVYILASIWPMFVSDNMHSLNELQFIESISDLYIVHLGLPALAFFAASKLIRKSDVRSKMGNYALLCRILGITLLYILAHLEFMSWLSDNHSYETRFSNKIYLFCILVFIYSLQLFQNGKKLDVAILRAISYIAYISADLLMIFTLLVGWGLALDNEIVPVLNLRFVAMASALVVSYWIYRNTRVRLLIYVGAIIGFLGLHLDALALAEYTVNILPTLSWACYSAILVLIGIYKPQKDCMYAGIILILATVGRLFFVDAADLDGIFKLMLFLAVGMILMILSFIYTKVRKN